MDNPNHLTRRVIQIAIIFTLASISALCVTTTILLSRTYQKISPAIANLEQASANALEITNQAKDISSNSATFVRQFTDQAHREHLDEYITLQLQHTRRTSSYARQAARGIREIIDDTHNILEKDVQQLILNTNNAVDSNSRALLAVSEELRKQIAINGSQGSVVLANTSEALETANRTLLTANQLLTYAKDTTFTELNDEIEQLNKLTSHLTVLAGDPEIANAIKSLAATSANVQVITADLSTLTGRLARPKPPKNVLDKYLVRPAANTLRLLVLGGQLALVFRQF
jgi:hypothetical protein